MLSRQAGAAVGGMSANCRQNVWHAYRRRRAGKEGRLFARVALGTAPIPLSVPVAGPVFRALGVLATMEAAVSLSLVAVATPGLGGILLPKG